ncbi:hypothetical protein [Streptomyces sp. NPDC086519]
MTATAQKERRPERTQRSGPLLPGEGLAAIAYALPEVAAAIRDHTASQE